MMQQQPASATSSGTARPAGTPSSLIWDAPTAAVVDRLRQRFGHGAFGIVERWDSDVCSVGLVRGAETSLLAIVSTCGCGEGRYDVVLERGPAPGLDGEFTSGGHHEGVDFDTLAGLVAAHLSLDADAT